MRRAEREGHCAGACAAGDRDAALAWRLRLLAAEYDVAGGGAEDLLACVRPGLTGIILPKASVEEVRLANDALSYAEGKAGMQHGDVGIIALPETPEGVRSGYDIAKASRRVKGLLGGVGTIEGDVAWTCGFRPTVEGREQLYFQSKIILDSRAAGAAFPIAGVFSPRIDDLATLEAFVRRARELGFTGAAVIHPSHVKIVNAVFQPSEQDVAHYEGLIAALEEGHRRGEGAVRYKGAMVDLAMLPIARDVVAEASRRKLPGDKSIGAITSRPILGHQYVRV